VSAGVRDAARTRSVAELQATALRAIWLARLLWGTSQNPDPPFPARTRL